MSAGEAMAIIVAVRLGMALPIAAVQILWINLVSSIIRWAIVGGDLVWHI